MNRTQYRQRRKRHNSLKRYLASEHFMSISTELEWVRNERDDWRVRYELAQARLKDAFKRIKELESQLKK